MDEELKAKLNEMSLNLIDQIQKGAGWTGEQANLFVQEYLRYYLTYNCIYGVLYSLCFALSLYFFIFLWKPFYKGMKAAEFDVMPLIIPLAASVIGILIFCNFAFEKWTNVVKVNIAPRVVLVEELKKFVK